MPFLSFDLDAKKRVALAARALGVEPGVIAWGLLELWEHAWATKQDVVGELILDGCFGPNPRIREALVAFGFLEAADTGWRVKGASKYLGISESRSAAGKARAAGPRNERGQLMPSKSPASAGEAIQDEPALTPNTQHPTPNTQKTTTAPPEKRPAGHRVEPPDAPVSQWVGEDFWRYLQDRRFAAGYPPEPWPNMRALSDWWSACLMSPGVTTKAMKEGVHAFGEDTYWEAKGYPFNAFKKDWHKYVRLEVSDGVAA